MKNLHFLRLLLALLLLAGAAPAQNPRLDPAFSLPVLHRLGQVNCVVAQPDGKILVGGIFTRLGTTPAANLVRLLPNGQPDPVFQANVPGFNTPVYGVARLPNGKILVNLSRLVQIGGVTYSGMLMLNADGTRDATFNLSSNGVRATNLKMVGQPDGKILIAGSFTSVNGLTASYLARLNANGTLDTAFQAAGLDLNAEVNALVLQPDGKIVVGGNFSLAQAQFSEGLVRVLPSGARDLTFGAPSGLREVYGLGLLPGGSLAVLGEGLRPNFPLARLRPNGSLDPTFGPGANLSAPYGPRYSTLLVQANGGLLVSVVQNQYDGVPTGPLFRVLPSGALDPTFVAGLALSRGYITPVQVAELPNGQLLAASPARNLVPTGRALPVALARFGANGAFDASLAPDFYEPGLMADVARQPDGRLVVGGEFTEINGTPAGNLARLDAAGTVEAAFTAAAATDGPVRRVLVQPNGQVLALGYFERAGGGAQRALARLQPTGVRDAAFAPPLRVDVDGAVASLALQPNGQVLLVGSFRLTGSPGRERRFVRFNAADGSPDASFQPADTLIINDVLVRPGGEIVVAGQRSEANNQLQAVWQLLPSGVRDAGFASATRPLNNVFVFAGTALALGAGGELYAARTQVTTSTSTTQTDVVRLLPTGSADPAFATNLPQGRLELLALAVQPNGRVLVGGLVQRTSAAPTRGSLRLLPTGADDPSYDPVNGPSFGTTYPYGVARIVVQPDGGLLMAGAFLEAAGRPVQGLVRLLDPNVLALRPGGGATAGLRAWPVPAHTELNLRFEGSAAPVHQLELLDVLGRAVLRRTVAGATATLPLTGVAPGVYVLRHSAPGEAGGSRRVVVE